MVLGKTSKLVPVMLMNVVLYGRRFPLYKYISVLAITVGVSGFMIFDPKNQNKASGTNSLYGILLLSINLLLDGITNSTQDQLFFNHSVTGIQLMFYMNLFGSLYHLIYLLNPWNPHLTEAIFLIRAIPSCLYDILLFSVCGSLGQIFIFSMLESFGSVWLVTITVTRKLFTILLSLLWFNHPMNPIQWLFVVLVFAALIMEAYFKRPHDNQNEETRNVEKPKLKKN